MPPSLKEIQNRLSKQNFGENDSMIVSAVMHPVEAAKRAANWFQNNVNAAAGYADPYDNPNPLVTNDANRINGAINLVGLMQGGGANFAPKSAGGTVGTFIGPKSKMWDSAAAEKAVKALDAGAHPAEVWSDHLIGRMPDGALFSEIDDSVSHLAKPLTRQQFTSPHQLSEVLQNHDAMSAYPDLANMTVKPLHGMASGSYNGVTDTISVAPKLGWDKKIYTDPAKSTLLHEMQHAIQAREGWGQGGNPMMFEKNGQEQYRRLVGEAQARATQDRMKMSMSDRRSNYPLSGDKLSDIPVLDLIYKYK